MIQSVPQERVISIRLGELHATDDADAVLVARGLGSCLAVCAYDPLRKIGGMAHMVLPCSSHGRVTVHGAKFVDAGIPRLLQDMERLGATRLHMIIKIVGGAHMIASPGLNGTANIGNQNIRAARAVLADLGLRLRGDDVGGNRGRTVRLYVGSGRVTVSTVGGHSCEL